MKKKILTVKEFFENAREIFSLELVNGNRAKAARMMGIGERTMYRKIKQYDLT